MPTLIGPELVTCRGLFQGQVLPIAATSYDSWKDFRKTLDAKNQLVTQLRRGLTWSHIMAQRHDEMNAYSWEFVTRSLVTPYVHEEFLSYVTGLVPEVPQTYYNVAAGLTKMDFFLAMHELEDREVHFGPAAAQKQLQLDRLSTEYLQLETAAVLTPEMDPELTGPVTISPSFRPKLLTAKRREITLVRRELDQFRQLSSLRMDSRRPTATQIREYYHPRIRAQIVRLLAAGDWQDSPDEWYTDPVGARWTTDPTDYEGIEVRKRMVRQDYVAAVLALNQRMRAHPMGRNSHLRFSENPGKPRRVVNQYTGKNASNPALQNPYVQEYLAAPRAERLAMLARNGALTYLLKQADVAPERSYRRTP